MRINSRLLLVLALIALIPLTVISTVFYLSGKEALTSEVLSHLQSVAAIQRHRIESIVEQNLERLALVSSRTQLRLSLDSFGRNPNVEDQEKMNKILLDTLSSVSSFQCVCVLTLDGEVVASTDAARIGDIWSSDEVFIRGREENTADILFLNENRGLGVYLSGPLYLEEKLLGVVVIESTADNIISSIKDYAGLGATGETLLARTNENGDALFLTPTRFDEHAGLSRSVPKEDSDSPTIQALLGNVELFTDTVDYRGEPVLAATQYISKTGWGLVTKIDRAEALASVTDFHYLSVGAILLSVVLVLLVSLFLARVITRPIVKLAQVATRVSEGDLAVRAEVGSRDEIGVLAQAFNQMKDNLARTNSQLEQELAERKQAEEKYSTLVEQGNDGIVLIQDGLVKFANTKIVEMTGFSLDEATGSSFVDFVAPEYKAQVMEDYQRRVSREEVVNPFEIEIVAKDGRRIAVELNASRIEYEGKPADMAIMRDITERKLAEEKAKELQEHLQLQVNRMPIGLIVWDTDFRVRSWNPAAERIFGFTAGEALGKQSYDITVAREAQPHVEDIWRRLLEGDETAHSTHKNKTKDGHSILCEWTNTPLRVADGTVVGVLSMVQDITERKQAEDALRASERKLRLMFESVTDGIVVTDMNAELVQLNGAVVRMHGYDSKEELVGRSAFEFIAERDHARAMENLRKTLEEGYGESVEYMFLTKDGREFPAELSAAVLRDDEGNAAGFIAITKDITERKKMEEGLMLTDRLASVGELASGVAHELNNPLTGVIGLSQLLAERELPEDVKEDLKLVNSEAQRAANVVKNLLTFARKHPPSKQLLNINEVIGKVLEIRAYEERVSNIEVVTHLAPDLPQIMADYFQLQQVFLNIVINAEHFMIEAHSKGTLTIKTQKVGGGVKASFADDGPSISKEDLGHIFDPFFTTKEVGKGTGLGLSICHGIISAHNGQIYAKSEPGKGATFIVELPLGQEEH